MVQLAVMQMSPPRQSKTCDEYCDIKITDKTKTFVASVKRVGLVFDIYQRSSCKRETRDIYQR